MPLVSVPPGNMATISWSEGADGIVRVNVAASEAISIRMVPAPLLAVALLPDVIMCTPSLLIINQLILIKFVPSEYSI